MARTSCFVHTLQLVVNMIHKDTSVKHLLEKAKATVRQFRKSSVATGKLHQHCGFALLTSCGTRWSSTFQMFSRLLQVKDSVVQVVEEMRWDSLRPPEWIKMAAVRELLLPFADHTQALQSDTMSLSLVVPALLDLTIHLSQFAAECRHKDVCSLAKKMKADLVQRFRYFLNPSEARFSPLAAAACFLDPTVARETLIEHLDNGVQEELLKAAEKYILSVTASTPAAQRADEPERYDGDASRDADEVPPKRPRFKFLASQHSKQPRASIAQQEMRKYKDELLSQQIPDFEHGLDFWLSQNPMTYVTLKPLALDLLAMPASQAFAERVFSIPDNFTRAHCNKARVMLERRAFLKLNWVN